MKQISVILLAATLGLLTAAGCKKSNSSSSEETCEPVTFKSTVEDGRYIVILGDDASNGRTAQTEAGVRQIATSLLKKYDISDASLDEVITSAGKGFIARLTAAQAAQVMADGDVKILEQDRLITLGSGCFSVVSASSAQWGVRMTGVGDGTGKRIWIVDTGVDTDHPDLTVDSTLSKSFVSTENYVEDNNGHGTHVAGIIAAKNNTFGTLGVASGATVISLKVLDGDGNGNTSNIINALNYLAQHAVSGDVVNMSLGADTISKSLDNAVTTLAGKGILFSIAAGNETKDATNYSPARVNATNVYTVSAIDSLGVFASFSNFGSGVDYAAPGVDVISTYSKGRYARMSGTSMAAPHLAGILLLNGTAIVSNTTATKDPDGSADKIAKAYLQ